LFVYLQRKKTLILGCDGLQEGGRRNEEGGGKGMRSTFGKGRGRQTTCKKKEG
jgi:hypothetical protein